MNGQKTLLQMLSAAGRGEELDPKLLAVESLDTDQIMAPPKGAGVAWSHDNVLRPSTLSATPAPPSGSPEVVIMELLAIHR